MFRGMGWRVSRNSNSPALPAQHVSHVASMGTSVHSSIGILHRSSTSGQQQTARAAELQDTEQAMEVDVCGVRTPFESSMEIPHANADAQVPSDGMVNSTVVGHSTIGPPMRDSTPGPSEIVVRFPFTGHDSSS